MLRNRRPGSHRLGRRDRAVGLRRSQRLSIRADRNGCGALRDQCTPRWLRADQHRWISRRPEERERPRQLECCRRRRRRRVQLGRGQHRRGGRRRGDVGLRPDLSLQKGGRCSRRLMEPVSRTTRADAARSSALIAFRRSGRLSHPICVARQRRIARCAPDRPARCTARCALHFRRISSTARRPGRPTSTPWRTSRCGHR